VKSDDDFMKGRKTEENVFGSKDSFYPFMFDLLAAITLIYVTFVNIE
jgi:hypothetical protein